MIKLIDDDKRVWLEALDTYPKTERYLAEMNTYTYLYSYCCLGVAGSVLLNLSDYDLEKESDYITTIDKSLITKKAFKSTYSLLKEVLIQDVTEDDEMLAYVNEYYLSTGFEDFMGTIETFLIYVNDRTNTFEEVKDFITKYL